MMEQLYQALLHLLPGDFRDQFGSEMQGVFLQAAEEARNQGSVAYGVFAVREIAGLLVESLVNRTQLPRRALLIPAWGLGGFLAAMIVVFLLGPNTYTSVAMLRIAPGIISDRLVPGHVAPRDSDLTAIIGPSLARPPLVNIIQTLELYLSERSRTPMEKIVERMKADIRITLDAEGREVMIRFRHTEREMARKVSQSLASRLINEFLHFQTHRAEATEKFLNEQTEAAAAEWQRQSELLRKSDALSKERLALDADLARKQYVSLKEKLSEAALTRKLQDRQQGQVIELLEPASMPVVPDHDRTIIVVAGTLGGGLVGLLLAWLGPLRRRKLPALVPPEL